MKARPAHETLESLRLTLLKVEQSVEPGHDEEALAELKHILLQRIAELEAIQVVESAEAQIAAKPDPATLVPPASMAVEGQEDIASEAGPVIPPVKPN
jgi:hypothetical protein